MEERGDSGDEEKGIRWWVVFGCANKVEETKKYKQINAFTILRKTIVVSNFK